MSSTTIRVTIKRVRRRAYLVEQEDPSHVNLVNDSNIRSLPYNQEASHFSDRCHPKILYEK